MTNLEKRQKQTTCPSCGTAPLQEVEKDVITEVQYDLEGNGYPKAKVIFPAYRHCNFCFTDFFTDFTLKEKRNEML